MLAELPDLSRLTIQAKEGAGGADGADDDGDDADVDEEELFGPESDGGDAAEELARIQRILMAPSPEPPDPAPTPPPEPKPAAFMRPPPALPEPRPPPLLQPGGIVATVGGQELLLSTNPRAWSVLSTEEVDLVSTNNKKADKQPRPTHDGGSSFLVSGTLSVPSDRPLKFVAWPIDICVEEGGITKKVRVALIVLDPNDRSIEQDKTVGVLSANGKRKYQISTNPYRPTTLRQRRYKKLGATEKVGTRYGQTNDFQMYDAVPPGSPTITLSVMSSKACYPSHKREGAIDVEFFYLVSARVAPPPRPEGKEESVIDINDRVQRKRKEASDRWKRRLNPMKKGTRHHHSGSCVHGIGDVSDSSSEEE